MGIEGATGGNSVGGGASVAAAGGAGGGTEVASGSGGGGAQAEGAVAEGAAGEAGAEDTAWNGELDSLDTQDWYKGLDEGIRGNLRKGYESKLKAYDKGFQEKFRKHADERKTWETSKRADLERIQKERADLEALLYGEGDPHATLKEQYERDLKSAREEAEGYKGKLSAFEKQQQEQAADQIHDWVKTNAADVYENDEAFTVLVDLLASGHDPQKALKMVKATMSEAEEPPRSVKAAGPDSRAGNTAGTQTLSWRDAIRAETRRLRA